MKLFETYNISVSKIKKQDGTDCTYAYIDPKKSTDSTIAIKDDIKQFGAKWNSINKVWGWYLSSDPINLKSQLEKYVYPAIEYLNSKETTPEGQEPRTADSMKAEFNKLLKELNTIIAAPSITSMSNVRPIMDEATLKAKLKEFKQELIESMSSEEFLKMMEPIIKFRNAQGHQLSLANAILIYLQDPKSKLVKSRKTWDTIYNRTVNEGAPALWIYIAVNNNGKNFATAKEKEEKIKEFLKQHNKTSEDELTPGEKDILRVELLSFKQNPSAISFKNVPCYFDVRYTTQKPGTEDTVGNMDTIDQIEWTDEKSEPTELTINMYNAMLQIIQEAGIKLGFVDDLGGAMGVSKSGQIDVLKKNNKNAGAVNTLIHEFAHELLHQTYLQKARNDQEWATFFVGKEQGRAVVEQQAELTAYIVMRLFGIKMQQAINYMGCWGADKTKAPFVFDTVANVASKISSKIEEKLGLKKANNLNEDEEEFNFKQLITGEDVAEAIGPEAIQLYNQYKDQDIRMVAENFKKFFDRINQDLF